MQSFVHRHRKFAVNLVEELPNVVITDGVDLWWHSGDLNLLT